MIFLDVLVCVFNNHNFFVVHFDRFVVHAVRFSESTVSMTFINYKLCNCYMEPNFRNSFLLV
jgi:hypothetical protein